MAETNEGKLEAAERLIRKHAIGAAAVGLVPIPLVDLPLLVGLQVNLVRALADLYGLPFSNEIGKSIVSGLIGAVLPASALGTLKAVPLVASLGSSALAAASTMAVGKIFVQHFESGGTILTFDPKAVREHYEQELRKHASQDEDGDGVVDEDDFGGVMP